MKKVIDFLATMFAVISYFFRSLFSKKTLVILALNDGEGLRIAQKLISAGATWQKFGHENPEKVEIIENTAVTEQKLENVIFVTSEMGWGVTAQTMEWFLKTLSRLWVGQVVFVELRPQFGVVVDHHKYNDTENYFGRKSSLEQICEMFGIEMDELDRFIGANDEGYIPAMLKLAAELGYTEEQAAKVVRQVREGEFIAQGITADHITEAETAIETSFVYDARLVIVNVVNFKAQTVVVDNLYYAEKYKRMVHNNTVVISKSDNGRIVVFCGAEIRAELFKIYKPKITELGWKVWSGGQGDYGFFGIQFTPETSQETKNKVAKEVAAWLEKNILGYERMLGAEHITASEAFSETVHIHTVNDATVFHACISEAKKSEYGPFVHLYSIEEYVEKMTKGGKAFIVNAGAAGFFVTAEGDIVSVFKNEDIAGKDFLKSAMNFIMVKALKEGGVTLDCFDGFLPGQYYKFGFEAITKVEFDPEFQPDGWKPEFGQPDIIFMAHNGDSVETVLERQKNNPYAKFAGAGSIAYAPSYHEAGDLVREFLKK